MFASNLAILLVLVLFWQAQPSARITLEIELDHHCRLVADDAAIVSGLDNDHLGCGEIERAAVGKSHVDPAAREEANMRMLAGFSADVRFDVARPVKAHRVDRAFHARIPGADGVQLHPGKIAVLRPGYGCYERIR